MKYFDHINAKHLQEAVSLLKLYDGKAVINAGGTDVLGVLKDQILPDYPEALINIKSIAGLDHIREESEELIMGATTCLANITQSEIIKKTYPMLAEAAKSVATPQIRNMATLGGNLCQDTRCWYYRYPHQIGGRMMCLRKGGKGCFAVRGDNRYHAILGFNKCLAVCPSDLAVALTALNAQISIVGTGASRSIPVSTLYHDMGNTLKTDEIVTDVRIPKPLPGTSQVFLKFTLKKPVDFAVVSVAAIIRLEGTVCKDARIVMGAVAPIPFRAFSSEEAIKGKTLNETAIAEAAETAVAGSKPLNMTGYKIEVTKAMVKRALFKAMPVKY